MKQESVNNRIRGCYILIGLSVIDGAYSMNDSVSLYNYISGKLYGAANHLYALCMCDRYEDLNNSAVQSKTSVACVKAFLDAVCESNGEVELKEIENGTDVYHCLESLRRLVNNTDFSQFINGLDVEGLVKRQVNKKAEEKPKQEEKNKAAAVQPQQNVGAQQPMVAGTTNNTQVRQGQTAAPQKMFRPMAPGTFVEKQPDVKEKMAAQPVQPAARTQQQQSQTAPTVATQPQPAAGTTNSNQTQQKPVKFSPGVLKKR